MPTHRADSTRDATTDGGNASANHELAPSFLHLLQDHQLAHCIFNDPDGTAWEVWDVHPTSTERRALPDRRIVARRDVERRKITTFRVSLPEELRLGWLAFRSRFERRQFAPIPAGWSDMDADELRRLLRDSRPSGSPRRLVD